MTSPVDICNLALSSLGQPTIVQIDPPDANSKAARLCAQLYPSLRDETLTAHPWRRLKKRVTIAASVVAPDWGFTTQYPIPADLIGFINDLYVGGRKLMHFEFEGEFILCNETGPLQIRYLRKSEDPNEWDSLMQQAVSYRLAVDLAEPLTQDASKKQFAIGKYAEVMRTAKSVSAQQGTPVTLGLPDPWVTARYGGTDGLLTRRISEP